MGLGEPWNRTVGSDSKLNLMTVVSDTGANLSILNKTRHKLVVCTATGSGFIVDHVYCANAAADAWIDISTTAAHEHSSSTDGGNIIDVFISNPKLMDLALTRTNDLNRARYIETTTGSATIADDTDGTSGERSIKLLTGATSGSGATIAYPHLQLDFSKRSMYQFKGRFSATTDLALHSGVQADHVTAADSNTRKYNAEVCTSTNGNWWLRSANGTNNATSDSGTAFTTNRTGIRIEHYPDIGTPELDMYIGAGSAFQKTSSIPFDGATADNNLITHSLKNSATFDKNFWMYGCRLVYSISDEWA